MSDSSDGPVLAQVERLFFETLEQPTERRSAFLDAACEGDHALKRRVERLVRADNGASRLIDDAPWHGDREAAGSGASATHSNVGDRVGAYCLRQLINVGGMGEVWFAERSDGQFEQRVAVKLIKPGMDSDDILLRFRRERQVLAHLNHPNVARLVGGGATDDHRPYLVMEYIDGKPIDRYCDEQRLTVTQRLDLFLKVCDAVHYAHTNLVVHRDLKPSNVLVDKAGQPKLLDFGIAKVLGADSSSPSLSVTATGHRLLTPRYASPEQVRGEPISTVSDVYSLGVLLFELLTGSLPYGRSTRSRYEMERQILDTLPTRPSESVSRSIAPTSSDRLESRSAHCGDPSGAPSIWVARSTEPARLRKSLRGDLDTIVLKALRKESSERYASAEQFAEDIRRHMEGMPLLARRAGLARRGIRALRRNRKSLIVAAVTSFIALVTSATALTYWFMAPGWAREHVRDAHLSLLNPSHLSGTVWNILFYEGNPWRNRGQRPEVDVPAARKALAIYADALRLDSGNERAYLESSTLSLAVALATRPQNGPLIPERFRHISPLTSRFWDDWFAEDIVPEISDEALETAGSEDLRSLGLLNMLCGDIATAMRVWSHLGPVDADPLIEALLGVMYLALDQPELAYPRLLSSYREYPESGVLCTYLADAALQCGDVTLAGKLLDHTVTLEGSDGFGALPRIQMMYYFATDQEELAQGVYESNEFRVTNPVAAVQYAQHLHDRGDIRRALAVFVPECGSRDPSRVAGRKLREFHRMTESWWAELDEAQRSEVVISTVQNSSPRNPESFVALLHAYHRSVAPRGAWRGQKGDPSPDAMQHSSGPSQPFARSELLALYEGLEIENHYRWEHLDRYPPVLQMVQILAWTSPVSQELSAQIAIEYENWREAIVTDDQAPYEKLLPASARDAQAGQVVDVHGDSALICSRTEAFVYRRSPNGWTLEHQMSFPHGRLLGSLDDDLLMLAIQSGDVESWSALLLEREPKLASWSTVATLTPPARDTDGREIVQGGALADDVALIGVARHRQEGSPDLSLLAFRRDAAEGIWRFDADVPIVSENPSAHIASLATDGYLAVVALAGPDGGYRTHVFNYDAVARTWRQEAALRLPTVLEGNFGGTESVACNGDIVVVGATTHAVGKVFVYRRDPTSGAWMLDAELGELLPRRPSNLGVYVAIDGDRIVAGTREPTGRRSPEWHLFDFDRDYDSWMYSGVVAEQDSALFDYPHGGVQLAISGNTLIAGAPLHDGAAIDAGAAFVFDLQSALQSPD